MSDEIKERAVEIFRTFGEKVVDGSATGDDVGVFRDGLRGIAEDLELDLSAYEEHIKPVLDEAQANFDVNEFKERLKPLAMSVCQYFEIDPEELKSVCEE